MLKAVDDCQFDSASTAGGGVGEGKREVKEKAATREGEVGWRGGGQK